MTYVKEGGRVEEMEAEVHRMKTSCYQESHDYQLKHELRSRSAYLSAKAIGPTRHLPILGPKSKLSPPDQPTSLPCWS